VADHFQYLASLGLITLLAGSVATARRSAARTRAGVIAGIVVLAALAPLTWRQARVYRNLETLWNDTLAKNPGAWMAHNNLGSVLSRRGDWAGAQRRFEEVLRLRPNDPEALNNLGFALYKQGRAEEAIRRYEAALASKPELADVQNNWGQALVALGRYAEAASRYQEALRIRPQHPEALSNYGALLLDHLKQPQEAATLFRRALAARPGFAEAHLNYGLALIALGDRGQAEREIREALRLSPRLAAAHYRLGLLLAERQAYGDAIAEHRTALALRPNWIEAMRDLAWLRATCPDARLRDEAEAVALAEQICRPSALPPDPGRRAASFDVLAAAYARAGRFAQAAEAAERAIDLLQAQPQSPRRGEIEARLRLYREGRPYTAGRGQ
jgi:tetratricopeptide (TPR) repeat protein